MPKQSPPQTPKAKHQQREFPGSRNRSPTKSLLKKKGISFGIYLNRDAPETKMAQYLKKRLNVVDSASTRKSLPPQAEQLSDHLLNFREIIPIELEDGFWGHDEDSSSSPGENNISYCADTGSCQLACVALELCHRAGSLESECETESTWISEIGQPLFEKVLQPERQLSTALVHQIHIDKDAQFIQERYKGFLSTVEHRNTENLTKPKPDHTFSFSVKKSGRDGDLKRHHELVVNLSPKLNLPPSPFSKMHPHRGYAWGLYEAKREGGDNRDKLTEEVTNQAGHAAAVCLSMMSRLSDSPKSTPPVIAFASVGPEWLVFICTASANTEHPKKSLYDISLVWEGNVTSPWDTLQLVTIVARAREHALRNVRQWIISRLGNLEEDIKQKSEAALRVDDGDEAREITPAPTKYGSSSSIKNLTRGIKNVKLDGNGESAFSDSKAQIGRDIKGDTKKGRASERDPLSKLDPSAINVVNSRMSSGARARSEKLAIDAALESPTPKSRNNRR